MPLFRKLLVASLGVAVVSALACGSDDGGGDANDAAAGGDATASGSSPSSSGNPDPGGDAQTPVDAGPPPVFPHDFQFGTATAGFQIEMGCPTITGALCEDRNSDWYQWITTERIVNNSLLHMSGDAPRTGPGFYETYAEDIQRAGGTGTQELGSQTLRLSIEWSRLFPQPTFALQGYEQMRAAASPAGLAFYHAVLRELRERGMRASVTVTHYSLPLWIHDGAMCNENMEACIAAGKGGWADPNRSRIVDEIAKYAGFLAKEFGDEVDEWATENEPFSAVVVPGYLIATESRSNPPGRSAPAWAHIDGARTAYLALIEAHARMYDAIKANDTVDADGDGDPAKVGIVYAYTRVDPLTDNAGDADAAEKAKYFFHDMFMDGVARGIVDEQWNKGKGQGTYRADLDNRLDWVGVNYYFRFYAQNSTVPYLAFISPLINFNMLQPFDTQFPQGIEQAIGYATQYGKPIIVSETGFPDDQDKAAAWLTISLDKIKTLRAAGTDIRGFYAWSLMDNYEWNHGMGMRFGLYAVDPTTKARSFTISGASYRAIIQARDVPSEQLAAAQLLFPTP